LLLRSPVLACRCICSNSCSIQFISFIVKGQLLQSD
jgi:hypothetical protein